MSRPAPYGRRLLVLVLLVALPGALGMIVLAQLELGMAAERTSVVVATLAAVTLALSAQRFATRPLATLANILGGLRRGDYSMRSTRARPDDPLGMVMLEANELVETMRAQRLGALEATALLRKVMSEIDVSIFAFDDDGRLALVNRAAELLLGQSQKRLEGQSAEQLGLQEFLSGPTPRTVELTFVGGNGRGELRRGSFRQDGRPHTLVVVADLSRALRQEELTAWRRLVRVLSHEINNSLTPIASAAGSLKRFVDPQRREDDWQEDLGEGLELIEGRAKALGRFMGAYAKLARLPEPRRRAVQLGALVRRVCALETRRRVEVEDGPEIELQADPDQLEQVLINLVTNAVDAVLEEGGGVRVRLSETRREVTIEIEDDGPGIASTANLFVPFFSTKPGGSGIGLALSRQIAEVHGGSLTLANREDGRGCLATVRLPR